MRERLVDELAKTAYPERTQLILALAPGCLFGFPPPNLDKLIERVDCEACMGIAKRIKLATAKSDEIDRQTREYIKEYRAKLKFWHKLPILKRFAPKCDPNVDENLSDEFCELLSEAESLKMNDPRHWDTADKRDVGREFITAFVGRDDWTCFSFGARDSGF